MFIPILGSQNAPKSELVLELFRNQPLHLDLCSFLFLRTTSEPFSLSLSKAFKRWMSVDVARCSSSTRGGPLSAHNARSQSSSLHDTGEITVAEVKMLGMPHRHQVWNFPIWHTDRNGTAINEINTFGLVRFELFFLEGEGLLISRFLWFKLSRGTMRRLHSVENNVPYALWTRSWISSAHVCLFVHKHYNRELHIYIYNIYIYIPLPCPNRSVSHKSWAATTSTWNLRIPIRLESFHSNLDAGRRKHQSVIYPPPVNLPWKSLK